jgi:hypothetical protein
MDGLEWFIGKWGINSPSAAEQLIIDSLTSFGVRWEREVFFRNFRTERGGYYRFDFMVICPKTKHGFILIEYDGKNSHTTPEQKSIDERKTVFCIQHNIPLIRYNNKHYYSLATEIDKLLSKYL